MTVRPGWHGAPSEGHGTWMLHVMPDRTPRQKHRTSLDLADAALQPADAAEVVHLIRLATAGRLAPVPCPSVPAAVANPRRRNSCYT